MARALDGDTGPRLAGRLNALEGPHIEAPPLGTRQRETLERRARYAQRMVDSMVRRGGYRRDEIAEMVGKVTGTAPDRRTCAR